MKTKHPTKKIIIIFLIFIAFLISFYIQKSLNEKTEEKWKNELNLFLEKDRSEKIKTSKEEINEIKEIDYIGIKTSDIFYESEKIKIFSKNKNNTNYLILKNKNKNEEIILAKGGDGSEREVYIVVFRNVNFLNNSFVIYEVGYYEGSQYFIYDIKKKKNIFTDSVSNLHFTDDYRYFFSCTNLTAYSTYGVNIYNTETEKKVFNLVDYIKNLYNFKDTWEVSNTFPNIECKIKENIISINLNNKGSYSINKNKKLKFINLEYNTKYNKINIIGRNVYP